MHKRWVQAVIPTILIGATVTGCGAVAQGATPMNTTTGAGMNTTGSTMSNSTGNSMGSSSSSTVSKKTTVSAGTALKTSDVLVGAAASAPMGAGNGVFLFADVGKAMVTQLPLAMGANAFRIAITGNKAYVPTLQGKTYVVNLTTRMVTGSFATPTGSRMATIANAGKLLLITGSKSVTAYSLPSDKLQWTSKMGGNSLVVVNGKAYLSGNMMGKTAVIDLKTGKSTGTVAVGNIEDSVYDAQTHTLWLANWTNGDMTVVDTQNNQVVKTIQKAEGGGFNMKSMMQSKGGFMQLAVGPTGKYVYAASFSGNIMVYNAKNNSFVKDIKVGQGSKLSGLAVDSTGKYIYTTVENKKETVAVSLSSDKVVSMMPGILSNRWAVVHN